MTTFSDQLGNLIRKRNVDNRRQFHIPRLHGHLDLVIMPEAHHAQTNLLAADTQ